MATDAVVSRELKSLQEELSTSQREHVSPIPSAAAAASGATATPPPPPKEAAEERELRDQLRELDERGDERFSRKRRRTSPHIPPQSVVGALLVGSIDRPPARKALRSIPP